MTRRGLIVTLVVVCLAAACSSDPGSAQTGSSGAGAEPIAVTITHDACEPAQLRAQPGPVTVSVTNRDAGPEAAFSLLSGDELLGRLEPVVDGPGGTLTLDLAAGTYRIACRSDGGVGGGTLTVGDGTGPADLGQPADLQAAVAAYRGSLQDAAARFAAAATRLQAVIAAGDLAGARQAYADARTAYGPVKDAADNFGEPEPAGQTNLDHVIDAPLDEPPPAGTEPGGLHRIEAGLFTDGSTAEVEPVAAALVTAAGELTGRVAAAQLTAVQVAGGLAGPVGALVTEALRGRAEPASHLDLLDVEAEVEGTRLALDALRGPLDRRDPDLRSTVWARLATVDATLITLGPGGSVPAADASRPLAQALDALADALARVAPALTRPVSS
jgi:iron uptake system component EfeO